MQKISLFALVFVLIACSAPAPVIPTAPVTLTVPPTSIPTSIPTLTETATPIPTETATVEPAPTFEIASMAEFDPAWYKEVGKVIEVADLYGAGAATITVEAEKLPTEGQVLEYQTLVHKTDASVNIRGVRLDKINLGNLTIEGMRLVKVDLADNTINADGYWLVLQLGTKFDSNQLSFTMVDTGNVFMDHLPEKIFENWQAGQSIGSMSTSLSAKGLSTDDRETLFNLGDKTPEQRAKARFTKIGSMSAGNTWTTIMAEMKAGGILDTTKISIIDF